jgi:hypothetical protein
MDQYKAFEWGLVLKMPNGGALNFAFLRLFENQVTGIKALATVVIS